MQDKKTNQETSQETNQETNLSQPGGSFFKKVLSRINIHVVLIALVLICVLVVVYRINNWGTYIDLDELFKDGQSEYTETYDAILPLFDENDMPVYPEKDGPATIVVFGNAPFADDRDSEDSLAGLIADMSGATIYNCSVTGSYLASLPYNDEEAEPLNIFNFYWLCHLISGSMVDESFRKGMEALGEDAPPEAQEIYDTLKSIDFNEVDVIAVCYDASDYLAGHPCSNLQNLTDIDTFTGNLNAGIQLLQSVYPHIRIIVMSPTYAFGVEEDGTYVSSDIKRYHSDVLSTYVILESEISFRNSVSFVDNLYGTIHEDIADEYLIDNVHLNLKGRKKVAERFVYALQYFDNRQENTD